MKENKL